MLGLEESPDFRAPVLKLAGQVMLPKEPEYQRVRDSLERQTFNGTWDSLSIGCGVEIDSNREQVGSHPFGGSQSARID